MSYSIETLELGPMANLVYLLSDNKTKETAVIDPAWETDKIIALADKKGVKINQIWLTHAHHDHVNGIKAIKERYDAEIHLLKAEKNFWGGYIPDPVLHYGGDELSLGKTRIKILHTPGHSLGSACYLLDKQIITGDTLFVFGCGHCKLEGGDPETLYKTLQKMKKELDNQLEILPGHFYAEKATSSWEEQKQGNPFLLCESEEDFIRYRTEIHDKTRSEPYRAMNKIQVKDLLKRI